MGDVVELYDVVHERRDDGQLVEAERIWVGLLIPASLAESRQQAVEVLQRYAVEEKAWPAYPGSCGATGPYRYAHRRGELVRAVRWAPGDEDAGSWWRVILGQGMDSNLDATEAVSFADPLDLDALE